MNHYGEKLALIDEIIALISGSISGIPTIVIMIIPFIVGFIIGFFIKKILKIMIVVAIIALIASYFGIISLTSIATELTHLASTYGPQVYSYITLVIGILPLGLGFFIGLLIGFLLS
ncbi:MAG: hypothetical protein H3Z52_01475 [archaeon]|nr:hypothetical protein [archaeon]